MTVQCTDAELVCLLDFEKHHDDGVNTHLGMKRRVLANMLGKGYIQTAEPRDPDEVSRYELTLEGQVQLAQARQRRRVPHAGRWAS